MSKTGSMLLLSCVLALAPVSIRPAASGSGKTNAAAVADTRTYLSRLEPLGFSGVVLVAQGADPLIADGYGLADRERGLRWSPASVSTVGSITKQFTGAAILKLEEEGRLSVNDTLERHFPGVPADKRAITLHQLLSHSSGIADPEEIGDFSPVTTAEYLEKVFARKLLFEPGSAYEYANANFSLLGIIIEKLTGQSYESWLRERLFLPAGMFETGYQLPGWGDGRLAKGYREGKPWGTVLERPMAADGPYWALRANGGIHSTVYDMLRWARALLDGRVLSAAAMEKYWAPHVSEGGDTHYGYGWVIATAPGGARVVTHNGGNGIFFADMAIVPDADLVIVLMTNVISETRVTDPLIEEIVRRFVAGEPYPPIPKIIPADIAALAPLAGTYDLPGKSGSFRLTLQNESLWIEAGGRRAFPLLHSRSAADSDHLDRLNRRLERIVAANRRGDFVPLSKAYGGRFPADHLRSRWGEVVGEIEGRHGRLLRHEILGSARTQDRYETVVRFHCLNGTAERTYVWDSSREGKLLGVSMRGLNLKLRLVPCGEREFFTWDDGIRPPKLIRFKTDAKGRQVLALGEDKILVLRTPEISK